jgi:uncharacterized protein
MATVEAPPARRPEPSVADLPLVELPRAPDPGLLWSRILIFAGVMLGLYLLDQVANLLLQMWFLESLGLKSVFWTNFKVGAILFAIAFVLFGGAVAAPAIIHGLKGTARRRALGVAALVGVVAGYWASGRYMTYLMFLHGKSFHDKDPIYHHDIGFYVFKFPAILTTTWAATDLALVGLVAAIVFAAITRARRPRPEGMGRVATLFAELATPYTRGMLVFLVVTLAVDDWLRRYGLLTKGNVDRSIPRGASNLDVQGIWSNKHAFVVEAIAILVGGIVAARKLGQMRRAVERPESVRDWKQVRMRALVMALVPGLAVVFAFHALVGLRNQTQTTPNEPVVQLPFIKFHIDATNKAWGIDHVQTAQYQPKDKNDPKPSLNEILKHPTIQNAPLWPGYAAWLEKLIDPEYAQRVLQVQGDIPTRTQIYGPTLSTFQQQEKLRPYYDFMDVDTTRYYIHGHERLFTSSVRELPLLEPKPWLAWWGQRFVVFTHGYGLVMAEMNKSTRAGEPRYVSNAIPTRTRFPELKTKNQSIYYGEGAGSMAYSDVAKIAEHDHPTDEGRAQTKLPQNVNAGVKIDTPLKRIVFGYKSRQFLDIFFSNLIKKDSRVHYYRTPLERVERVAPFLYFDTDPYAVVDGKGIQWMVNGMTTSKRYPYSMIEELGDKSYRRSPTIRPTRWVNYARDSVKATVDAYTGHVHMYKIANEPVINTWSSVYPHMFRSKAVMPPRLRQQIQYPTQLFHTQFDDIYIYTHQKDPLTFFSQEDVYDDADEVLGPVLDEGHAISFSMEPYYWLAEPGTNGMPRSSEKTQFSMSMAFTPENALNLRAIATVYQDGKDYGKQSILEIPKGKYFQGTAQADAAIDQDPFISQQAGLWTRRGLELIRGHTTPLLVDGELIYIEPFFIRSKQNPLPRLQRVVVVVRGRAYMAETLHTALRAGLSPFPKFPIRPGPELGGEPPFILNKKKKRISQVSGNYKHTGNPKAARP